MDTRDKWREHIRHWKKSGLTRDEYAARARVNPGTLSYWKWRLGKEARSTKAKPRRKPPTFVELVPSASWSPKAERIELVVGEHVVVRVPVHFETESLRRVLSALRANESEEK